MRKVTNYAGVYKHADSTIYLHLGGVDLLCLEVGFELFSYKNFVYPELLSKL